MFGVGLPEFAGVIAVMLGLGACLVLRNELTAGAMIAAGLNALIPG